MPYEISIQDHQDYIRVELSGERTAGQEGADSIHVWSRVAEACRAKKIERVLAISTIAGHLPAGAAHSIAYRPDKFGWSRRFKVAFTAINPEALQGSLFAEDIAVSSGYQARVFDSEEKAKEWLFED